jgi:hypothetical protein
MSHYRYIAIIAFSGLVAWLGWLVIFFKLSPFDYPGVSLTFFYLTLFIALSCTFSVLGFYFRVWLFKNEIFYGHINVAFRQGVFLSLITIFCLVFQMIRVLTWWSGLLLIVIVLLLESYFSARDSELNP